jgi:hypothetical protein
VIQFYVELLVMSGDEESEFEFNSWISVLGLSPANVKKLETNLVTDLAVLTQLREEDIDYMKLGIGDAIRLRSGITKLKDLQVTPALVDEKGDIVIKPADKTSKGKDESAGKLLGPDGERVYSLAEVEKLVAGKASPGCIAGAADITTKNSALLSLASLLNKSSYGTDVKDLMRDLLGLEDQPLNAKGEKCLLPINFLSCVRGTQDSDEVIHSGKGLNLILQSNLRIQVKYCP